MFAQAQIGIAIFFGDKLLRAKFGALVAAITKRLAFREPASAEKILPPFFEGDFPRLIICNYWIGH